MKLTPTQRNGLQVRAFKATHKSRLSDGLGLDEAFAIAIVETSDKVFDRVAKRNPDLIQQWLERYQ